MQRKAWASARAARYESLATIATAQLAPGTAGPREQGPRTRSCTPSTTAAAAVETEAGEREEGRGMDGWREGEKTIFTHEYIFILLDSHS